MAAYLVVEINDVSDGDALRQYAEQVAPLVERNGGRYLARGPAATIEGDSRAQMLVIVEFPSMEQMQKLYHSADYAPLIKLRQSGCDSTFLGVEGL